MIKYKLFQVKSNLTRDYGFMGLLSMKDLGIEFNLENYDLAYEGSIESNSSNVLEELFKIFNVEHPKDFYGRSMSISDIVQIGDDYFYCDLFGWENISETLKGVNRNDKT